MATTSLPGVPLAPAHRPLRWFLDSDAANWRAELLRLLPYAGLYVLAHGLLVAFSFAVSTDPYASIAIWMPVGLLAAVLSATPARTWPVWIVASMLGRIVFEIMVLENRALVLPLLFSSVNVLEAVVFGLFMQRPLLQAHEEGRPLYLAVALTILAVACANIGGLAGGVVLEILVYSDLPFWTAWRLWSAGDFIGFILVVPLVLWLLLPQIRIDRAVAGKLEMAAMPMSLLFLALIVLPLEFAPDFEYEEPVRAGLMAVLALPVFWAAMRAEFLVSAAMQVLLAVTVIVGAMLGFGPFGHDVDTYLPNLAALQIYIAVIAITATVISFAVLERKKAYADALLQKRFSELIMTLTNKLVAAPTSIDELVNDSLQLISRFGGADRGILLQFSPDGRSVAATHAWSSEEVSPHPQIMLEADLDSFDWVMEKFRTDGYVAIRDFNAPLPQGAEELEKIRAASPDTVAAIYVGLFTDEQLIGAIGCGYVRSAANWNEETVSLMYLVGQLFANILKRKKVEERLGAYQQKLRTLATDMAIAEERTRRRTATDLHDGIGQNLAVARMKLGQLLASDGPADKQEMGLVRNLVDEALRGTRYIIADLSPSILYELGLVPALQSLAERFENANEVRCEVIDSGEPWEPGNDMRIAMYRAVQECLNNVARHARASEVTIRVDWTDDKLDIEIADDGVGMKNPEANALSPESTGFGLFSLKESMSLLGGNCDIESTRGIGTRIRLCVPRRQQEDGE